jgi:hypothetical protein
MVTEKGHKRIFVVGSLKGGEKACYRVLKAERTAAGGKPAFANRASDLAGTSRWPSSSVAGAKRHSELAPADFAAIPAESAGRSHGREGTRCSVAADGRIIPHRSEASSGRFRQTNS